jgi:5-formyltetrahydrofolate cyclo-ligase
MSAAKSNSQTSQNKIRIAGRSARKRMGGTERDIAAENITEKVVHSPWFQRAGCIACYLPTPQEVDTWMIIARAWSMKKRIFAPVIEKNRQMSFQEITPDTRIRINKFGLYEPDGGEIATARMLDVVLTPVVAFDSSNHRVGMGGGYFDTTFSFLKHRIIHFHPKLIGLAFACQKVKEIAPNPWDIPLFTVITEREQASVHAENL